MVFGKSNLWSQAAHGAVGAVAAMAGSALLDGVHAGARNFLETLAPFAFVPTRAALLVDEGSNVEDLEVAVALVLGHGKHEGALVEDAGDESAGTAVETKGIPGGKEAAQQHLEAANHRVDLGHDENEAFSR